MNLLHSIHFRNVNRQLRHLLNIISINSISTKGLPWRITPLHFTFKTKECTPQNPHVSTKNNKQDLICGQYSIECKTCLWSRAAWGTALRVTTSECSASPLVWLPQPLTQPLSMWEPGSHENKIQSGPCLTTLLKASYYPQETVQPPGLSLNPSHTTPLHSLKLQPTELPEHSLVSAPHSTMCSSQFLMPPWLRTLPSTCYHLL